MSEDIIQHFKKKISHKDIYDNLIINHFNIIKDIERIKYSNNILLNRINYYEEINTKLIWHIKYLSYSLTIFILLVLLLFFNL